MHTIVQTKGNRQVERDNAFYNLDMIIAHNTKYPLFSLSFPKDLLSLQLNNIKTMTVKAKDLPTNNLNINEIKQNTPPKITLGRFFCYNGAMMLL